MFPYTFEAVTAITITVLSIIITIYVVVLKKRGWLKEETSPESFFLCPNPECKKMFQKPMKLTDLSETPPREHSACPHCGVILIASLSKTQKKPKLAVETSPSQEKPRITIDDLLGREKYLKHTKEPMVPAKNQETRISIKSAEIPEEPKVTVETPKPVPAIELMREKEDNVEVAETPKPLENSHEYKALEHLKEKSLSIEHVKASEVSKEEVPTTSTSTKARPQDCPHYFGYLKTVPKDSVLPEECFCCPKIMECFYLRVVSE